MERRVVITAASALTPIGVTLPQIWDNLVRGVSGVRPLRPDPMLGTYLRSQVFGTIDPPLEFHFDRKWRKTMGPVGMLACRAAGEVLYQAGLPDAFLSSGRMGVAFGSLHGSLSVQRSLYESFFSHSESRFHAIGASDYLKAMVHTTAVNITRLFHITGRVISSNTACTTSAQSIGFGYEAIRYGLQDAMLCGGADEYDTVTVAVFDHLLATSTTFNDAPSRTPRPFDARRDGMVVGEGAGAVLLEDLDGARRRGAPILGEVLGFGCGNNGGDMILPNLAGVEQTLRMGLENAKLAPDDVDFVSAHATGTRMGDVIEAQAIRNICGERPWVTGFKGHMGHTMGACGAIETILTLLQMKHGLVAPTLNLEEVDPRCAIVRHTMQPREERIRVAAVENFAFGGVNTCLFLRRFDG
ncbi:MAG: beta-ketoacyl-[acyl-carrier-protein] synthase family protein [Deltaproteobacteria bacterium]|nr:beta-ketoacyl-[acyl-carrier-protein] synthase family protein [Deltaproteobacteria bacterium]